MWVRGSSGGPYQQGSSKKSGTQVSESPGSNLWEYAYRVDERVDLHGHPPALRPVSQMLGVCERRGIVRPAPDLAPGEKHNAHSPIHSPPVLQKSDVDQSRVDDESAWGLASSEPDSAGSWMDCTAPHTPAQPAATHPESLEARTVRSPNLPAVSAQPCGSLCDQNLK
ncbi:uncharacterized protein FIBRA_08917 [Fibroporia radiculosa]|uniref:Uncharacterized protein n=1 Tax=Fibroporia radiculosa TaxID=599839 RepID=J4ICL8_9APHY|nr:uncharacterized protein FIBRA_08917 [Fibroporia radiculosa]CCM06636.1 predicted protein [Fibroporia radiculosa]